MRSKKALKRLVSLVLGLVIVLGLAVPSYAEWWSNEPGIFIEDGTATIKTSDWGHIEISNAVSFESSELGQLVVHTTSPATITVFAGSRVEDKVVLGDLGHSVTLISHATDQINWDWATWEPTEITPTTGVMEYTMYGGIVDEIWFLGDVVYILDAGFYSLHAPAEGGIFVIVNDSDDTPVAPTPNLSTASQWAHEGISQAFELGLIPQSLQNNYTNNITRAEFAALAVTLYEALTGKEIAMTREIMFNDTTDINVYKAAYIGVVNGMGDGSFAPDATLTREQAAVMLVRLAYAIGQPLPQATSTFADNLQISQWAIENVGQIQTAGIMGGIGDNIFNPQGTFTREQSVLTVLRLFEVLS